MLPEGVKTGSSIVICKSNWHVIEMPFPNFDTKMGFLIVIAICVQKFLYQPSFSMQNRVPTQKVYAQAKLAQSTHKPGKRNTMISKNAMLRDRNHTLCSLHKNHDSILQ